VLVNKHESLLSSNPIPSATASEYCQSFFDPYELSSGDEEYLMPNDVAEMTPGQSDSAAGLLTATRLHLNSLPEAPKNRGQINPNLNDYHSDAMEISSTFWLPDMPHRWRQHKTMHSMYAELSNVANNILSILLHGVGVEAGFFLGRHSIG